MRRAAITLCLTLMALAASLVSGCSKKDSPTEPANPAPFAVSDLAVTAGTDSSVTLAWTAPRNPAGAPDALRYDLRYVTLGSEGSDRSLWTRAAAPVAHAGYAGHETHAVTHLTAGTVYVFSLIASLDGSLWSASSNFAVGTAAPQPDTTPPAGVTDLVQYAGTDTTLTVAWTLAGDDSTYGRATSYQVVVYHAPLSAANWDSATVVAGSPAPHANPARVTLTARGLVAGRTYYMALKATDDAGNRSRMSNVIAATTRTMHTYYIKADGSGDFRNIELAANAARPGDLVLIAPGRYTWTNQAPNDTASVMVLVHRDQTDFTIRGEAGAEATILDAERRGGVMYVTGGTFGNGEFSHIVIEGLTFTNGKADGQPAQLGKAWAGGGLCMHLSECEVRDCVMRNNTATEGGGIWAGGQGGVVLDNCLVEGNSSLRGGGIELINSDPLMTVRDCVIRNNHAILASGVTSGAGGGMFIIHVNVVLERNQVYGNVSDDKGGGLAFSTLNPDCVARSCTVVNNQAPNGAAVRVNSPTALRIENCLLAFNRIGATFSVEPGSAATAIGCSLVFGNDSGNQIPESFTDLGGNLTVNPLLCTDGLHPGANSPCLPEHNPTGGDCGLIGALPGGYCP